jgi:hypothetical protein
MRDDFILIKLVVYPTPSRTFVILILFLQNDEGRLRSLLTWIKL